MKSAHQMAGVTLVELLVALLIFSLGLVMMGPGLSSIGGGNKLESQSRELQNALVFARTEAIRLNQNVLFCHSSDSSVCSAPPASGWRGWLIRAAGPTIGAESGPVLRAQLFNDSSVVVSSGTLLANAQHALRFNSQGLIRVFGANTPLTDYIQLCIAQAALKPNLYQVQFNSGGRLQQVRKDNNGSCE